MYNNENLILAIILPHSLLGQLIREDNELLDKTYVYTYDNAGNITSKKTYAFTYFSNLGTPISTKNYGYSAYGWGDLLTSYGGTQITYDDIGNPLSYYTGQEFSWQGRQLSSVVDGSDTYTFVYNDQGIRTSKTKNGVTTTYYLNGSQIMAEETNGNITVYVYDASGMPIGMQYHGANYSANTWDTYWYEKNLFGDIVAVYGNDGTKLISYTYDAWGNFTTTYHNGTASTSVVAKNPFTYRGYYYDADLGLYYLQTRYYDSNTGRFINADNMMSGVNGSLHGYNLYAYCFNNPISMSDLSGNWPEWLKKLGKKLYNFGEALVSSFEIEVGFGVGVGFDFLNHATAEASKSTFVRLNDGAIETGNTIVSELSLFDSEIKLGDTYEHISEINGNRVSSANPYDKPFDMIKYPDTTHGNHISVGPISVNSNGDCVFSSSISIYIGFGGRISAGFNISEFIRRLRD